MVHSAKRLADDLSSRGVRMTRQRRVLLEAMEAAGHHVSATELFALARRLDPRIDRATVYRTLALLKRTEVIDELDLMHLEGTEHYYELRQRAGHVHIGCMRCGRIVEMQTDQVDALEREIKDRTGFAPNSIRVEVRALCPACQSAE